MAENFETWAVVEIMGHQMFAGLVGEQTVGGTTFVRVDVPAWLELDGTEHPEFTKLFGAGSIYCITPCTEVFARAAVRRCNQKPVNIYMPELYPPAPPRAIAHRYHPGTDEDHAEDRVDDDIPETAADFDEPESLLGHLG